MSDMRVTVNPAESFESLDSLDDKPKHKRTDSKSKKDRKKKKDWFVSNRFKQANFQAHTKLVQKMSHILRYLEFCPCKCLVFWGVQQKPLTVSLCQQHKTKKAGGNHSINGSAMTNKC